MSPRSGAARLLALLLLPGLSTAFAPEAQAQSDGAFIGRRTLSTTGEWSSTISENGGTAIIRARLSRGTGTIFATVDSPSATISPSQLVIDSSKVGRFQDFTVTGVDDDVLNETRRVNVAFRVEGVASNSGFINISDDDRPSVTVTPTRMGLANEGPFHLKYEMVRFQLDRQPFGTVTARISSDDNSIAQHYLHYQTFEPDPSHRNSWNRRRGFLLTGPHRASGRTNVNITFSGGGYDGLTVQIPVDTGTPAHIPDRTLRDELRAAIGTGGRLVIPHLAELTSLDISNKPALRDLTGLQHATNLTNLDLARNSISDLRPLAGLTALTELDLNGNDISNLAPLAGLTSLQSLILGGNNITDLTPLRDLTAIETLFLRNNQIEDITPLVANTGLDSGDTVSLFVNPLNDDAHATDVPALQARGVEVRFDLVCTRTPVVEDAILEAIPGNPDCDAVTEEQLAAITTLDLSSKGLTTLLPNDFDGLSGLQTLSLRGNRLENLHEDLFDGLTSLQTLNLNANRFSRLDGGLEQATSLTTLRLASNNIADLSPLASLTALTELDLHGNNISNLTPLSNLTALQKLVLGSNDITDVSPLRDLTAIETLFMRNNEIEDIEPLAANPGLGSGDTVSLFVNPLNADAYATHIPVLENRGVEVRFNYGICDRTDEVEAAILAAIPGDVACGEVIVEQLTAITSLDLEEQGIETLRPGDFTGLTGLTTLGLNDNQLTGIPDSMFEGLTSLTHLVLSRNQLVGLDDNVFDGLTNLQILDLEGNSLSSLDEDVFEDLTNLEAVSFINNSLTSLPANVFNGLTNLNALYLSTNSLTSLPANVFNGLTSLQTLSLSTNSLTSLPANVFNGLTSLQVLSLRNNRLTSLSANMFDDLTRLNRLALASNRISSLDANAFAGLTTNHVIIELQGNQLSTLPDGLFAGLQNATFQLVIPSTESNPGVPFPLPLELTRTNNPTPGGSAELKVHLAKGAPWPMTVPLSVTGPGSLSEASATIPQGATESQAITVSGMLADMTTTVTMNAPTIGDDYSAAFQAAVGSPLELRMAQGLIVTPGYTPGISSIFRDPAARAPEGGTKVYQVSLAAPPAANVTVCTRITGGSGIDSFSPSGCHPGYTTTINRGELTFTPSNWNQSQAMTVHLTEDDMDIARSPAIWIQIGREPIFTGDSHRVAVQRQMVIENNDRAGAAVSKTVLGVVEGGQSTYTLRLTSEPSPGLRSSDPPGTVTITPTVSGDGTATVTGPLTFTPSNWDQPQTVTVSGVSNGTATISHSIGFTGGLGHDGYCGGRRGFGHPCQRSLSAPEVALTVGPAASIPDANLRAVLEAAVGKSSGEAILPVELATVTELSIRNRTITDLTGLEHATSLTNLDAPRTNMGSAANLSVLSGLTSLTSLNLNTAGMSDLSPLAALTNLERLELVDNDITDVSPIEDLSSLKDLFLRDNDISNLGPLASGTAMGSGDRVDLRINPLDGAAYAYMRSMAGNGVTVQFDMCDGSTDRTETVKAAILAAIGGGVTCGGGIDESIVTPQQLAGITTLDLANQSLTSLGANDFAGLSGLQTLNLEGNSLTSLGEDVFARLSSLETLNLEDNSLTSLGEGVFAGLSSLETLDLEDNSLTALGEGVFTGLSSLETLDLEDNSLATLDESAFAGLTSLQTLNLTSNAITDVSSMEDLTSVTRLLLRNNDIENVGPLVSGSVLARGDTVAVQQNPLNLEASSTHIPALQARGVTVDFVDYGICDLRTPVVATAILAAIPGNVACGDVTEQQLAAITTLNLAAQQLTALQANDFVGLTGLTTLELRGNQLATLPENVLDGLTSLQTLDLGDNQFLSDLTGLGDATSLTTLDLARNDIADLSPLSGLTALTELDLNGNRVEDLSPLSELTALQRLILGGNNIVNVSPLQGLTSLNVLFLRDNDIENIETLVVNTGLDSGDRVSLLMNPLNDPARATHIPALQARGVEVRFDFAGAICDRTNVVVAEILAAIPGDVACGDVTGQQLAAITTLDIATHRGAVRAGDFFGLTGLTTLRLQGDQVSPWASPENLENLFDGLTNLQTLDIKENTLLRLPANIFSGLTNLQTLDLRDNIAMGLPANIFSGLTSLRTLDLGDDTLAGLVPAGIFSELTNLQTLNLDINSSPISLGEGVFDGLSNLQTLNLEDSGLISLPEDVFNDLSSLQTLNLEGNSLSSLDEDLFDDLTNLQTLNLEDTSLISLPEDVFNGLSSLQTLNLQSNLLSTVPGDQFSDLTSLTSLDLSYNRITSLSVDAFTSLSTNNVTVPIIVQLQGNQLSSLPDGLFAGLEYVTLLFVDGPTASNPGAPFPLALQLARTDTPTSVGSAEVKVHLAAGAPWTMTMPLSATGGAELSEATATIPKGATESQAITVFGMLPDTTTTVTLDAPPRIHDDYRAGPSGANAFPATFRTTLGDPLEVFTPNVNLLFFDADGSLNASIAEAGGTETYELALSSQPTADVTVTISIDDRGQPPAGATVTPTEVIFTPDNWNTRQSVTVTGIDDSIDNGDHRLQSISHVLASEDSNYNNTRYGWDLFILDDEIDAGVTLSKTELALAESETQHYTIVLNSQPSGDVTVMPMSWDVTIAELVSTQELPLTFTPDNWNVPQQVIVRGFYDNIVNDPPSRRTSISHNLYGGGYDNLTVEDVTVTVTDNASEVALRQDFTNSNADTAVFTMVAVPPPATDLEVMVMVNAVSVADTSAQSSSRDSSRQIIAASTRGSGVRQHWDRYNDYLVASLPNQPVGSLKRPGQSRVEVSKGENSITIPAGQGSVELVIRQVENMRVVMSIPLDETAEYRCQWDHEVVMEPGVAMSTEALRVGENGESASYNLALRLRPTGEVIVTPRSSDENVVTVSGPLTFTPNNWDQPQRVIVTGVDDPIDNDPARTAIISHRASGGGYDNITIPPVVATTTDDDRMGATVTPITLTVDEAGGTGTYTVVLTSRPTADVTVTPTSGDGTVATVSGPLTFTPSNWDQAQTVTVTGVDDLINNNPDRTVRVTHTVAGGDYSGVAIDDVSVTAVDDEVLSTISVRAVEASVIEGRPAEFELTATPAPTADLLVVVAVADPSGVLTEVGAIATVAVTIEANQSTALFELETDNDEVDELDARVTVTLEAVPNADYAVAAAPDNSASVMVMDNDGLTQERREEGIEHALGAFGRATGWDLVETIRNRSRNSAVQGKVFEVTNLPSFGIPSLGTAGLGTQGSSIKLSSIDLSEVLDRETEVRLTFNPQVAQASGSESSNKSPLVRAWIKGSKTDIDSDPFDGRTQEGEVVTGRLGVDAAYGSGWLVGSVFSWHDGNIEFDDSTFATSGGIDIDLLSINPYVSLTKGKLHLWGTIGGGIGELTYEDSPTDDPTSTSSDLRMLTAAVGAEYAFGRLGPFDLKGRGEGMIVNMKADDSSHALVGYDDIGVTVYGGRGELELGLPISFDSKQSEFRPYVFTGLRQDGGLGNDLALEYGGGFAIRTRSLVAEGTIRSQVGNEGDAVELKGYSISLAYDRGNDRKGLVAKFEQSAGPSSDYDPYSGGAFSLFNPRGAGTASRLHLGYGIGWDEQSLRPFVEMDWQESQESDLDIGLEYQYSNGSASLGYSDGELNLGFRFQKLF